MSGNQGILLETGTNELEVLEFYVDHPSVDGKSTERSRFGVNVAKVMEVVEAPADLEPEGTDRHPALMGTIPLRDLALPVVDLGRWLDLHRTPTPNENIIVTRFNNVVTGFLVTGVIQIHRVNWQDIESPGKVMSNMPGNCITGSMVIDGNFVLLIDLERALAELDETGTLEDDSDSADTGGEGRKVLLADDSTSVRALLSQRFDKAGFEVQAFMNGQEAWEELLQLRDRAEEQGVPVTDLLDVVVTDVEMPRMDGYTLTRQIKDDSTLSRLPVVLFSSLIAGDVAHKGEAVRADLQVTKPDFNNLTTKVMELIESRK
ncbi:MAG: chemotaxis protein [Desulfovibrio sp.]|jgi:two-component system chemotaxis response regulator CheV|nr:chemotaxis protein [Desulfovibrio sp.]